jgi:uncharacterized protein (DUF1697 family)
VYVAFLPREPRPEAVAALLACASDIDRFGVHGREVYWRARAGMGGSTFSGARLEKTLALPATLRNITTVRKLAAKYDV